MLEESSAKNLNEKFTHEIFRIVSPPSILSEFPIISINIETNHHKRRILMVGWFKKISISRIHSPNADQLFEEQLGKGLSNDSDEVS